VRRASLAFILATAVACSGSPATPLTADLGEPGPAHLSGAYTYTAFDDRGGVLLVGRLVVEQRPDSVLVGTWEIGWAPGADTSTEVGPQVGTGKLYGSVQNGRPSVDLNPGWADNNVFLVGESGHREITGEWSWSTFTGPRTGGAFVARRGS
jgi:hypothetical protein